MSVEKIALRALILWDSNLNIDCSIMFLVELVLVPPLSLSQPYVATYNFHILLVHVLCVFLMFVLLLFFHAPMFLLFCLPTGATLLFMLLFFLPLNSAV
jgi:hypothetical protein